MPVLVSNSATVAAAGTLPSKTIVAHVARPMLEMMYNDRANMIEK